MSTDRKSHTHGLCTLPGMKANVSVHALWWCMCSQEVINCTGACSGMKIEVFVVSELFEGKKIIERQVSLWPLMHGNPVLRLAQYCPSTACPVHICACPVLPSALCACFVRDLAFLLVCIACAHPVPVSMQVVVPSGLFIPALFLTAALCSLCALCMPLARTCQPHGM